MFRSVAELAALVRDGELSARELVGVSLERIAALDQAVGAFIDVDGERALAAAAQIGSGDPRPFAGVPIAIKNNRAVAGMRLTHGAALLAENLAGYDTSVVRRIRAAGFVIVGTTSLPEYGILPVTEPARFGPARNPWQLERTPGGSSGGSAAAVAAGMVPLAHGNDGGGSLRIPAACCGLVGLKAQRHRVSVAPELGASALVVDGVLTRTVAETAALLDVLAGYEPGDTAWAPPPPEPFARAAQREPRRLRIALTTVAPLPDVEPERESAAAAGRAGELLESLGHDVELIAPPWGEGSLEQLFGDYFAAQVAAAIHFAALTAGRAAPAAADMEPLSWELWRRGAEIDAVRFQVLQNRLAARMRAIVVKLAPYDALLTPALAARPLPIGALDAFAPRPLETFARSARFTPFTPVFNACGLPGDRAAAVRGRRWAPAGRPARRPCRGRRRAARARSAA